jgi:hypothetical protein
VAGFVGIRRVRGRWTAIAIGWLIAVGAGGATLAIASGIGDPSWPVIAGVLGAGVALVVAAVPRRVPFEVARGSITVREQALAISRVELAPWLYAGSGAAIGTVAIMRGEHGRLRIGGLHHDGDGYPLTARGETAVDLEIRAGELEAILGELGFVRGPRGPVIVRLGRNRQTLGFFLANYMVPMFAMMAIAVVCISVLGALGVFDASADARVGETAMAGVLAALGLGFAVWVLVQFRRRARIGCLVRCEDREMVLVRPGGRELARVAWSSVRVERLTLRVRKTLSSQPQLVVHLGPLTRLRIGIQDTRYLWRERTGKTLLPPRWLVGAADWEHLLEALRTHGVQSQ